MGKKAAGEFPIKVALRVRPLNKKELDARSHAIVNARPEENKVDLQVKQGHKTDIKTYSYDHVFGPESSQLDVYEKVVAPCVREVMEGYNCTVFAYGQTGTGKTFTMEGKHANTVCKSYKEDKMAGVIPRALNHIFDTLEATKNTEYSVRVSFLEIYNEDIFDLLTKMEDDTKRLRLFEDVNRKGSVVVQGLEEVTIHTRSEVYDVMAQGTEKRRTAATKMNKASSRSHSIFSITVHQKENSVGEELLKIGKMYLVDLAGAENIGRSGAVKDRAREAGNINQSLLTLGRVITKLVEKAGHIPYRESKLTRLLQDSLGGRTKTSIIATVSPAAVNFEESQSTMDYASRAQNILNRPEVNQKLSKKSLIKEYTSEIEKLKMDLLTAREKNGVYLSTDRYKEMTTQIEELGAQVETYVEEINKIKTLFEETSNELSTKTQHLEETTAVLEDTKTKLVSVEEKLEETEIDRDEQKHLVAVTSTTEENLATEAQEIIKVTDKTVEHIKELHAKVDRKAAVDQSNQSASSKLQSTLENIFDNMLKTNEKVSEDQMSAFSELDEQVKQSLSTIDQQRMKLQQKMDTFQSEVIQKSQEGDVLVSTFVQTVAKTSQESSAESKADLENMGNLIKDYTSQYSDIFSNTVQEILNSQQELLQDMQNKLVAATQTHQQNLNTFKEQHTEGLAGVKNAMDVFLESHISEYEQQAAMTNKHLQEETESSEKAMQAAQQQISHILSSLMNEQKIVRENHAENMRAKISEMREQTCKNVSLMQTKTEETKVFMEKSIDSITESITNESTALGDNVSKVKGSMVTVSEHVKQSEQDLSKHTTGVSDMVEKISKSQAHVAESISNDCETMTRDMNLIHGATVKSVEDYKEYSNESSSSMTEALSTQRQNVSHKISQFGERAQDSRSFVEENINESKNVVNKFIHEELQSDVPTGNTPARQQYAFNRTLPRTGPHSPILSEFRMKRASNLKHETSADIVEDEGKENEQPSKKLKESTSNDDVENQIVSKPAAVVEKKPLAIIN
eukprot:m.233541 g.233541  ORF g.233541 m.233541 type:complete len:1024 (-) comp16027_c2_seq10:1147-4218(-)